MRKSGEVNYKIDWASNEPQAIEDRKHYLSMLRRLLIDIKNIGSDLIDDVYEKYNVYIVEIDEFSRVNIDEPRGENG